MAGARSYTQHFLNRFGVPKCVRTHSLCLCDLTGAAEAALGILQMTLQATGPSGNDAVTLVTRDSGTRVAGPSSRAAVDAVLPVLAMVAKGHHSVLKRVAGTDGDGEGAASHGEEIERVREKERGGRGDGGGVQWS